MARPRMSNRLFRACWYTTTSAAAVVSAPLHWYRDAADIRDEKAVRDDVHEAWVEVADWAQHWQCCGHRIGACACDGDTCCIAWHAGSSGS